MGITFTIRLSGRDLGRICDCLISRSEAWHGTAEYLESGRTPRADFVIEQCNEAEEANALAADYGRIISSIDSQTEAQGESS